MLRFAPTRNSLLALLVAALSVPLFAQHQKREPLNAVQIDKIREAGIDPDERVKLYTQFVGEHVDTIHALAGRARSSARAHRLDSELLDLAALMDEFGSNLDLYSERKADVRKSLEALNKAAPGWLSAIRALSSEPIFDLSRKEAIDSAQDIADQAAQMLKEQTEYFKEHKEQRGQDRYEHQ